MCHDMMAVLALCSFTSAVAPAATASQNFSNDGQPRNQLRTQRPLRTNIYLFIDTVRVLSSASFESKRLLNAQPPDRRRRIQIRSCCPLRRHA